MILFTLCHPRNFTKFPNLLRRQMPVCTAGKTAQRQPCKSHAPECRDTAANRGKHTAHLSVAPLMDDRLHHRVSPVGTENTQPCGGGSAVFEQDSTAQLFQPICRDLSHHLCMVDLVDLVAWMEQPLRQCSIVRDEEQPLRIGIEPPHGIEPRREIGQEIEHCFAPPIVPRRREISARLVEENIKSLFLWLNTVAIDGNDMMCRIIFRAELRHDSTIHTDPARTNHLLCRTA